MSKIITSVFFCFVFLFSVNFVQAGVIINEVMYNPPDGSIYEWVEIFNNGNEQIDLDGWRFFNSETVSAPLRTSGSFILEPNNYALITGNNSSVSFSGQVFTSSQFSLPNDSSKYGTYKGIYSDSSKTIGNSVTYNTGLGASGDGNSLQKISGSWVVATPTQGAENKTLQIDNDNNNDNNSNSNLNTNTDTNTTIPETKTKIIENPTMKAKILANNLVFTGQSFEIGTNISGFSNENVVLGRVYWNFGDGSSFEQINNFEKFYHTYYYAGEYVVFLEYYKDTFSKVPEITNKIIIKVVPTTVSISKVGDMKDFFIELTNNASYDIDVSNWVINANGKIFVLPKNSVIMSKKQMTISSKITGFIYGDQYNLKLLSPTNELIFDYSTSLTNKNIPKVAFLKTNTTSNNASTNESENEKNMPSFINLNTVNKNNADSVLDGQVPIDNLGAEVIKSDIPINNNFKYGVFGLIAFLGVSTSAAYVIRNRGKKIVSKANGDDFEILDE
ncbi:MAG: lamin tail domain-containing protein [Candidatus Paceibacterota bacterium]